MILLILLGVPLVASVILAFVGDRKFAPEINIVGSALTCVAGIRLALEVSMLGPMLAGKKFFFVDAFNVYLAVLTAFVSMTTAVFSRKYMLYITTLSGYLIDFYDKNPNEEVMDEFLETLKTKTFAYLKEKYAIIDVDIPMEKQIENLNFLKDRNVITEKEYEALKEKLKNINIDVKGFKY